MSGVNAGFGGDERGASYALLPVPQSVKFFGGYARLNSGCELRCTGVEDEDAALELLKRELAVLERPATGGPEECSAIDLRVEPGLIDTPANGEREQQAYMLEIRQDGARIEANAAPGLFYGAQTLLQLIKTERADPGVVPTVRILDWPRYELRVIHWDTKHHRDRLETLRRYLDQASGFKINAVLFELDDKFEYPSHPQIGAPGAFTSAELQGLVDYALKRHIQIIPMIQGPAHMCYALKHDEFAHLRCDGSNYQICMDLPEARELLFDMYEDVCRATRGTRYFHVSTDEVYYAGICEKFRKPYNAENRSLTWVDYVNAAHAFLKKKGRETIIWGEYPLLAEHVHLLPDGILNGVGFHNEQLTRKEKEHGIRRFTYCPAQGSELTFPAYFAGHGRYGAERRGRLHDLFERTSECAVEGCDAAGAICAAWDDSGLHNETFWLGWATHAQASWSQGAASPAQTVATFMELFYGPRVEDMEFVYRTLQSQARFMEFAMEKLPSTVRGPAYGHPGWKGPMPRTDITMIPPAEPSLPNDTAITVKKDFARRYRDVIKELPRRLDENRRLLDRLMENEKNATRNRYNLQVLISIARYIRFFEELVGGIADAEDLLHCAAKAGKSGDPDAVLSRMIEARGKIVPLLDAMPLLLEDTRRVWEQSRLPKGVAEGGREFLHVMDDVKDHFADRRRGLDYLIAPFEQIGLDRWLERLDEVIAEYRKVKRATPAACSQGDGGQVE